MKMIDKILKGNKEVGFFTDIHFDLEENERMHSILSQTRIDKRTAEEMEGSMKIVYKNGVASELYWIEEGEYSQENIRFKVAPVKYRDYPINNFLTLLVDDEGIHQLGGRAPSNFIYPETNTKTPYVYLGYLTRKDPSLSWLPMDIFHLICPIHSDFEVIYLDYSDPINPKLMESKENLQRSITSSELPQSNRIEFEACSISLNKHKLDYSILGSALGNIGSPSWLQHEIIPRCPKSNEEMKFVLQLESNSHIKLRKSDVELIADDKMEDLAHFDFWGGGILYVFMEPITKTVAYYIQNT